MHHKKHQIKNKINYRFDKVMAITWTYFCVLKKNTKPWNSKSNKPQSVLLQSQNKTRTVSSMCSIHLAPEILSFSRSLPTKAADVLDVNWIWYSDGGALTLNGPSQLKSSNLQAAEVVNDWCESVVIQIITLICKHIFFLLLLLKAFQEQNNRASTLNNIHDK